MTTPTTVPARHRPGRGLLLLGVALLVLGVVAYAVQLSTQRLTAPWYVPVAGTLGVLCIVASLAQARSVWRWLALLVVGLLCAAEWAFVVETRLPAYTGPVAVGQPFPTFATSRADGTPFTDADLRGDRDNVLVFFRGRW